MIKLGFIGCGGIARRHALAVKEVKGVQAVAAADISADALKAFGEANGVAALYGDYRRMLRKADVDAVCVALPTGLHKRATVAAAKAGKHVFCEKPMAMSLPDADAMIEACATASVKLMIAQVRRYDSNWGAFRKLIQSGAIGRPVLWRQLSGSTGPWRWFMDAKMGGGPFIDGCVHNWDFANYTFGEAKEALGSIMQLYQDSALDTGFVAVRYKSGDEIALTWSWGLPQGCATGRAHEALGPKGVILFPEFLSPDDYPKDFDHEKFGAFLVDTGKKKRLARFRKQDMFVEEWKDFRDAVVKDRPPLVTGEIGKQAIAVALAALKTGATRKPVKI